MISMILNIYLCETLPVTRHGYMMCDYKRFVSKNTIKKTKSICENLFYNC